MYKLAMGLGCAGWRKPNSTGADWDLEVKGNAAQRTAHSLQGQSQTSALFLQHLIWSPEAHGASAKGLFCHSKSSGSFKFDGNESPSLTQSTGGARLGQPLRRANLPSHQ